MITKYSWDEIFVKAIDKGFGSDELKAKDNAREQVRSLVMTAGGGDIDSDECPEESVEYYCDVMKILFDEKGNIDSITFPDWLEKIVAHRTSIEYLRDDLYHTLISLVGYTPDITESDITEIVKIFKDNADGTKSKTLKGAVREFLQRDTRKTMQIFDEAFHRQYESLYEGNEDYSRDADKFDEEYLIAHEDFIGRFDLYRKDLISSDREAAAFVRTYKRIFER